MQQETLLEPILHTWVDPDQLLLEGRPRNISSTNVSCNSVLGIRKKSHTSRLQEPIWIGYLSVGKSHKRFHRPIISLYTFLFQCCSDVSHSSGAEAKEETTAILVNFRISHNMLATVWQVSNMWCNIERIRTNAFRVFCGRKMLISQFLCFWEGPVTLRKSDIGLPLKTWLSAWCLKSHLQHETKSQTLGDPQLSVASFL